MGKNYKYYKTLYENTLKELNKTDYTVIKIKEAEIYYPDEVEALKSQYAPIMAERKALRIKADNYYRLMKEELKEGLKS